MNLNREREFERQTRGLESLLPECMLADRTRLGRQLTHLRRSSKRGSKRQKDPGAELAQLRLQAETSCRLRHRRSRLTPSIQNPEELPISAARDEILKLFRQHPVIVVAGDTGSGKTTQIPKIWLEAGRGREARSARTQPRRVAALRRAGQAADCAVCGDDLAPPYAKCSCCGGGASGGRAMRAHLHCLATSFITRAEDSARAAAAPLPATPAPSTTAPTARSNIAVPSSA